MADKNGWESPRVPVSPSLAFDLIAEGAQFRDRIAIPVHAPPDAIFHALYEVRVSDMWIAWCLGTLRYLPARLSGRAPAGNPARPFFDNVIEGGTLVLRDDRPREIITGSAGRLHRIVDQAPVRFGDRSAFHAFNDEDHEKLFMSIRVEPIGRPGEHWLVLEHATRALSPAAERKFARYWTLVRPLGAFVTRQLLHAVRRKCERIAVARVQRAA